MTQEIKQRIEQLRLNKTPDGYKKTTVGVIPQEWEVVRFKKLFSRLTRRNTEHNKNVLTISAQYGLISQEEFFNKTVASENTENYFLLNKGDFAYNKSYSNGYPFGAIKSLTKYDKGIVSPLYICFSVSEENKFPEFYNQYFEAGKFNREINAYAQEGARNHGLLNIAVEDFFNSLLIKPPLTEQQKIAEILSTQDKVIELQQKRIDELKKLKKAYLSKMFPQKGSNIPELRFKGFTGNWEQHKLGECFDERSERSAEGELISVTISEGIKKFAELGRHDNSSEDKSHYKRVEIGDIAYNSMRMWQGASGYSNYSGILSPAYTVCVPHVNVDSLFFSYMFKLPELIHTFEINSQGLTKDTWNLKFPAFSEIQIKAPKNLAEQQKIGSFFRTLDNIITLQSRKLDAEKLKKKSLMQLLLTGIVRVK